MTTDKKPYVKKTYTKPEPKKETLPAVKAPAPVEVPADIIKDLVLTGNIGRMNPEEKVRYYTLLCKSLGLNPLTQPFQIIILQGKEILYATKTATEQLRKIYGVSVEKIEQKVIGDVCVTTCSVRDSTGRTDGATGAVSIAGLKGDMMANAIMKSETKSKRRATLSICGLGMLDETELETIPGAKNPTVQIEIQDTAKKIEDTFSVSATPEKIDKEKINQLPDIAKKGFGILGYTYATINAFCNKFGWDNNRILAEINRIVDMKTSINKDDEK